MNLESSHWPPQISSAELEAKAGPALDPFPTQRELMLLGKVLT